MSPTLFQKTDRRSSWKLDRTEKDSAGEDLSGETTDQGTDQTGGDAFKPAEDTHPEMHENVQPAEERKVKRSLGLYPPDKTPLEKLAHLLERAENSFGTARINYMEQLVIFLGNNRNLVKIAPKGKYNALELALEIGPAHVIDELINNLQATVRSERKVVPIRGFRM